MANVTTFTGKVTPPFTGGVQRFLGDKIFEIASVKDFGAVGDGATDDTAAFQAGVDALYAAGGGHLFVPMPTSYYRTLLPIYLKDNVYVVGAPGRPSIRNEFASAAWNVPAIVAGTYYARGQAGDAFTETGYDIADTAEWAASVTLDAAGDAANFAVGDLVIVHEGDLTGSWYANSCLNRVREIDGAILYLEDTMPGVMATGAASPKVRRLGTIGSPGGATGTNGASAYSVVDCGLANLDLRSSLTLGFKAVHVGGAFNASIKNCTIAGFAGVSGNPVSRLSIDRDTEVRYMREGIELAYCSGRNHIAAKCRRIGVNNPVATFAFGIKIGHEDTFGLNVVEAEIVDNITNGGTQNLISIHGRYDLVKNANVYSNNTGGGGGISLDGPSQFAENCRVWRANQANYRLVDPGATLINCYSYAPGTKDLIVSAAATGGRVIGGNITLAGTTDSAGDLQISTNAMGMPLRTAGTTGATTTANGTLTAIDDAGSTVYLLTAAAP